MAFNEAQKRAIRHTDGPALVLAGPGSGKTTVITNRVRYLTEKVGVEPGNILVITFTRAAAREMKERYERITGTGCSRVSFGTFHSVFFMILKLAYRYQASNIVKEEQRIQFIREQLDQTDLEIEDEGEFISSVLSEISLIKGELMSLDNYYAKSCSQTVFKELYDGYEHRLRKQGLLDFDDMLAMCYELFKERKDILQAWQRKYKYILIDEFQDINQIQYEIVKMLALPENNLFIVGDDDQSIYRFRGARPELMLGFEKDYPDAERILLDVNYRCVDPVIESAGKLIANNKTRFQKEIHGNRGKGCPVFVKEWPDPLAETKAITEELRDYHLMGIAYEDMAVLYRTNQGPRFIVGDDDQSIYRFRGARPELMLGFEKDYPDAERILLDVNYRCVDPVIESAGKLIANNKTRFQKEIHGNRGKGCPVFVKEWPDPLAETKAITEELRDYHLMGIAYEDMAVLYRTNQGPRLLIERMMEYNIPFHMRDTVPNLYEHWISRNVFCYIYAALGDLSRSNILQIINRPARYISRDALDTKVIRWEQLRSFYQDKNWMLDRIDQLVYDLEMLREMAPAGAVNYIRKAIGYDDYLREYANERRLKPEDLFEVLDALQESAVPFKTYEAWFNHMDEYKEQLKEQSALREAEKEGVSLMTMHSCKGLEFKVVYILDTNEGITPHHKAVLEPDLEEERRMFYVAMTRAKDRLHIFYVKERYHKRQTVSRFVVETGLLGKKGDLEKNGKQGRK